MRNRLWKAFRTSRLQKSGSYSRKQPLLRSTHTTEAQLTSPEFPRKNILPLIHSLGKIKNDLSFHHLILQRKHLFQEASGSLFFNKSQGLNEIMQLNQNSYTTLPTYKYYRKKILLKAEKYNVFLLKAISLSPRENECHGAERHEAKSTAEPGLLLGWPLPTPSSTAVVSPGITRTRQAELRNIYRSTSANSVPETSALLLTRGSHHH